jgi:hypothetical protein
MIIKQRREIFEFINQSFGERGWSENATGGK